MFAVAPYDSPLSDFISAVNCKKLRTLATFDSRMSSLDIKAITQLKCLRTLILSNSGIEELPEELGEWRHLRFLDLSLNGDLKKLPDSLGKLYNLETLCLTECSKLTRLPENMGNLIKLKHLHTMGCRGLQYLPRGLARLTTLQTLNTCPVVDDDKGSIEGLKSGDLGSLDQLQGSLLISFKQNLKDAASEAKKASLWNKKLYYLGLSSLSRLEEQSHVQVLEALRPHPRLESLNIYMYGGNTLPSWVTCLQNLRYLNLRLLHECECLPPLGILPLLERLKLSEESEEGWRRIFGNKGHSNIVMICFIPKIENTHLHVMDEWEQREGVEGDEVTIMPCLLTLEIQLCHKLMNLPLFLQNTPISKFSILGCRWGFIMPVWPDNCDVQIVWGR